MVDQAFAVKLPVEVLEITRSFIDGLQVILGENLFGAYLYGALLFPDAGPPQDIDCHVIVRAPLQPDEVGSLQALHSDLACQYPGLGAELDAYYILLAQARSPAIPQHQLNPAIFDRSWALHCAHIRAGRYLALCGPEPWGIFPAPTWEAVSAALQHELQFVRDHLAYPAYCALNLCRILYSYTEHNPVISKQASGYWAAARFPHWSRLIGAAIRYYQHSCLAQDDQLLSDQIKSFLDFIEMRLAEYRGLST